MSIFVPNGGIFSLPQPDLSTPAAVTAFLKANNIGKVISQSGAALTRTSVNGAADATFQALAQVPVGNNLIGNNGSLLIFPLWTVPNSASSKRLQVFLGSTELRRLALTTSVSQMDAVMISNRNAANSQIAGPAQLVGSAYSVSTNALTTAAEDTAGAINLNIGCSWGAAANAETIRLESYVVFLLPKT